MNRALIEFACEKCNAPLEIGMKKGGTLSTCPECDSVIRIPWQSQSPALEAASGDPTVPVNLTLPNGAGINAQVSRSDAGKIVFTIVGAVLAIVGVFLGIKWNRRA